MKYCTTAEKILNKHYPLVSKTVIRKENVKWMDDEFRRNRALRRKLEKQWRREKTEDKRSQYIEQRNLCAKMSTEKQEKFYAKVVEVAGNDQKTLFKRAEVLPRFMEATQRGFEFFLLVDVTLMLIDNA